ncbi:MAG: 6-phosphofructokinase [Clostridia bacterium]|nr:6-phosphofructokinase [Clostridia bacterium]
MKKRNAVVAQSGGPTCAINATLAGVVRGAAASEEIGTLYGALNGIEGMLDGDGRVVDLGSLIKDSDGIRLLAATPAAALGSCRKKLPRPDDPDGQATYGKLFDFFARYDIGYFFYIGGNDSMDTADKVSKYAAAHGIDIRVIGIPKTIDNDLLGTDHTPGYGSAAKYIAVSMAEMIRDCAVYTVRAVTVVEIMGRDAGWLTAAAALPRLNGEGPDYIYLPERAFDRDRFIDDVKAALERHPNVVVAVSEGIRDSEGHYVGEGTQSGSLDVFGHRYLAGTGKALELLVKEKIGCKVRSVELNILQRCASHMASLTDINESLMIGEAGVRAAVSGITGRMMSFERTGGKYSVRAVSKEISGLANKVKTVPDKFINSEGNDVTDECVEYLRPLIEGENPIEFVNGLPRHFVIS